MLLKKNSFKSSRGIQLATYYKSSVAPESTKAILLCHGYAEYVDRYRSFIDRLSKEGFHIFTLDHQGHGRSDGLRAYIPSFDHLVEDVTDWLRDLRAQHPAYEWYVFGHSMGGGIALDVTLRNQDHIKALVLCGPLIQLPDTVPLPVQWIGRLLAKIFPKLPVVPVDFDLISRDPDVVRIYKQDPLVYSGKVRARTAIELDRFSKRIQGRLSELHVPFWVGHGSLDRITDPIGSFLLHQKASSFDKTHKVYHGLFHEILNEPEGQVVMHDIMLWLSKH